MPRPRVARPSAFLLAAAVASGLALGTSAPATEVLLDGIAAQVGSDIVLVSEVRELAGPGEEQLRSMGAPPSEIARLRSEVLETLVERALIRQVVVRSELGASEEEVTAAIQAIAQENQLTLEQIQASVESQGLSFQEYRDKIRAEIERTKVVNGMVASRVRVEEDEVRLLFAEEFAEQPRGGTEFHLRHLLVPVASPKPEALRQACASARQAREEIAGGVPFGQMAGRISPVNPRQGGDIGWVHEDSLAAWMEPVVGGLAPGETSPVIETPFGCNLLQLVERRSFAPMTWEQAKEPLRQRIYSERLREEYVRFVERLRKRTYIQRKGFFADAARLGEAPGVATGAPTPPAPAPSP